MKRFFGLMPSEEVKIEREFIDDFGITILIQAGPNGWTVCWGDGSADWKDEKDTSINNFQKAYALVVDNIGPLKERKKDADM